MKFRGLQYISDFTNPKMPQVSKGFVMTISQDGIMMWHTSLFYKKHKEHIALIDIEEVTTKTETIHKTLSACGVPEVGQLC